MLHDGTLTLDWPNFTSPADIRPHLDRIEIQDIDLVRNIPYRRQIISVHVEPLMGVVDCKFRGQIIKMLVLTEEKSTAQNAGNGWTILQATVSLYLDRRVL